MPEEGPGAALEPDKGSETVVRSSEVEGRSGGGREGSRAVQ